MIWFFKLIKVMSRDVIVNVSQNIFLFLININKSKIKSNIYKKRWFLRL